MWGMHPSSSLIQGIQAQNMIKFSLHMSPCDSIKTMQLTARLKSESIGEKIHFQVYVR